MHAFQQAMCHAPAAFVAPAAAPVPAMADAVAGAARIGHAPKPRLNM